MTKVAQLSTDRCDNSPFCAALRSCPQGAIIKKGKSEGLLGMFGGGTIAIDPEKCTGCGLCVRYCPHGAITMVNK